MYCQMKNTLDQGYVTSTVQRAIFTISAAKKEKL